jgi:hypothetical protein
MSFDGQWATSFGQMTLRQDGNRVTGSYGRNGTENGIEGTVEAGLLTFRYEEANERGTGWFRLRRPSSFSGEYLAERNTRPLPWQGWRGFDGLWDTSMGRLRLVQEDGRVWGTSESDATLRLQGSLEPGGRLPFRLEGPTIQGAGHFEIDSLGFALDGELDSLGHLEEASAGTREPPPFLTSTGPIGGQRAMPRPGVSCLLVLEAYRQRALDDSEFAFSRALRELASRLPWTVVRHRFYDDEAGLLRWCRQLLYLPEPTVLVVIGREERPGAGSAPSGVGQKPSLAGMVDGLRFADGLKLLHLSSAGSLAGPEAGRALKEIPFPVSGYTGTASGDEYALADMVYLDLILNKGVPPEQAAEQLPLLVRFAGAEAIPGSPYRPAGFTYVGPDSRLAAAPFGPMPGSVSRSKLH